MASRSAFLSLAVSFLPLLVGNDLATRCCGADKTPSKEGGGHSSTEDTLSKEPVIPEGVVYKKASRDVNRKALDKLTHAFLKNDRKAKLEDLFSTKLICGPGLWSKIKDDQEMKKITTGVTQIRVPTKNGVQLLEGKLFQTAAEVKAFGKLFRRTYKFDRTSHIRRPTPAELNLYWAMIPFDITEPIFVVESKSAKILAQFVEKDVKIIWIDDYQEMH